MMNKEVPTEADRPYNLDSALNTLAWRVQFGAAKGALDLRAHYRDREMTVSRLPHG
jgi:hypothetical protein